MLYTQDSSVQYPKIRFELFRDKTEEDWHHFCRQNGKLWTFLMKNHIEGPLRFFNFKKF